MSVAGIEQPWLPKQPLFVTAWKRKKKLKTPVIGSELVNA
tara:strand:- start:1676 stop:1795 length:120 start_codon:yes stop_codon:yes gene_type:complete